MLFGSWLQECTVWAEWQVSFLSQRALFGWLPNRPWGQATSRSWLVLAEPFHLHVLSNPCMAGPCHLPRAPVTGHSQHFQHSPWLTGGGRASFNLAFFFLLALPSLFSVNVWCHFYIWKGNESELKDNSSGFSGSTAVYASGLEHVRSDISVYQRALGGVTTDVIQPGEPQNQAVPSVLPSPQMTLLFMEWEEQGTAQLLILQIGPNHQDNAFWLYLLDRSFIFLRAELKRPKTFILIFVRKKN